MHKSKLGADLQAPFSGVLRLVFYFYFLALPTGGEAGVLRAGGNGTSISEWNRSKGVNGDLILDLYPDKYPDR